MTRVLAAAALLILLGHCRKDEGVELPIPMADLPPVLLDIHLAETAAQSLYGYPRDSVLEVYYAQVCSLHQVDRRDLDSTIARLRRDPEKMHWVYNQMLGLIAEQEADLQNEEE